MATLGDAQLELLRTLFQSALLSPEARVLAEREYFAIMTPFLALHSFPEKKSKGLRYFFSIDFNPQLTGDALFSKFLELLE